MWKITDETCNHKQVNTATSNKGVLFRSTSQKGAGKTIKPDKVPPAKKVSPVDDGIDCTPVQTHLGDHREHGLEYAIDETEVTEELYMCGDICLKYHHDKVRLRLNASVSCSLINQAILEVLKLFIVTTIPLFMNSPYFVKSLYFY